MISIDGDSGRCGKGEAAESASPSRGCSLGRDDNIGATVTRVGVVLFDTRAYALQPRY